MTGNGRMVSQHCCWHVYDKIVTRLDIVVSRVCLIRSYKYA